MKPIKEQFQTLWTDQNKTRFSGNLMRKTDVCKFKTIYDEEIIAKTISIFELQDILSDFPKYYKIVQISTSQQKLLKTINSVIAHSDMTPTAMYLHFDFSFSISLETIEEIFRRFEDICHNVNDSKKPSIAYSCNTSKRIPHQKSKLLLIMFYT